MVRARRDANGRQLPQAIAHRGYKAAFPENTMAAFEGAVEVGTHALETDIHLTKDGVVVLSHDPTLKRCFGRPDKIIDLDWKEVSQVETLAEPRQHMPRLKDLLEYLAKPGMEDLWVLLDIKVCRLIDLLYISDCGQMDNLADDVMRLIAETIQSVRPNEKRAWNERVVLGIWAVRSLMLDVLKRSNIQQTKYLPLCDKYLPGFPVTHIGFSVFYAYQFLKVPNVAFNLLLIGIVGPFGARFIRKAKAQDREIFAWTVNEDKKMRWCIRKQLDGVCTDDPKRFLEICEEQKMIREPWTWRELAQFIRMNIILTIFSMLFRLRFGYKVDQQLTRRASIEGQKAS